MMSNTKTMRRWEMNALGRENLALREVEIPTPGAGELLIKVAAASLNYRDKLVIESGMGLALTYPFTPASDLAGTVVARGAGAERFAVGDRVIAAFHPTWIEGRKPHGTARTPPYRTLGGVHPGVLAEYVAFPEDWLVRAPATLDDVAASTLACAGLTAWYALIERGGLHAGQRVLIEGTGGVALFGLQIAKAHGAEVVVTTSGEAKRARVQALGADHVIDRSREDWVEAVLQWTGDRGVDHVLELVGGPNLGRAAQVAAVGGQIYQIGVLEGFELSTPTALVMLKGLTIHGIGVGHRRALEDFVTAVDRIGIKPVIDERYGLAALPAALDHLERGPFGKLVVDVAR